MASSAVEFAENLARRFPALAGLLKEHVAEFDGVLPHLFMADVTRHVLADPPDRKAIVEFLDASLLSAADDVQNVIAASFVENLADPNEFEKALAGVAAEAVRAEWHRQGWG